jgi:hypothetical protein
MSLSPFSPDPFASMPMPELLQLRQALEQIVHPQEAASLGFDAPLAAPPALGTPQLGLPGLDSFSLGGPPLNAFSSSPCGSIGQGAIDPSSILGPPLLAPPMSSPCGGGADLSQILPTLMQALQGMGPLSGLDSSPSGCAGSLSPQSFQNMFPTPSWGTGIPSLGSGLPSIGGAQSGAPNAAAQQALNFSAAQMNPATANAQNPNNGQSEAQSPQAWDDWCLAFVSAAYGYQVPELRAATATDAYKNLAAEGKIQTQGNPPAGAPVFFDSQPWGHVAIATGKTAPDGEPIIRSTGWPGHSGIFEVTLSQLAQMTNSNYLGYATI